MMKKSRIFGIIAMVAVMGFGMTACPDGGGGDGAGGGGGDGVTLPKSSGTNEVAGKTLYLSSPGFGKPKPPPEPGSSSHPDKIDFAAAGTAFTWYEYDYWDSQSDKPTIEGSYSYNSGSHTITLAIEYVYWRDYETGNRTKMNKTQAKNAAGKEFDEEIARIRANFDEMVLQNAVEELGLYDWWYDYYEAGEPDDRDAFLKQWLTQKGYNSATLISQWKSDNPSMNTADKHINYWLVTVEGYNSLAEAKAAHISYVDEEFALTTYDYQFTADNALLVQEKLPANKGSNELSGKTFDGGYEEYTFTASGYTRKDTYDDQTTETGTYAYDSVAKRVWLRPETVYRWSSSELLTMLEYYESEAYGDTAAEKAGDTNSTFNNWRWGENYGLTPVNWIVWYWD